MRTVECPKCGTDVSDSYQSAEPDVGIMGSGWYCDACDLAIDDQGDDYHDDDVQISGSNIAKIVSSCQHCLYPLACGYGLAGGGGIGPYMYCPNENCGKTIIKFIEESRSDV